MRYLSIYKSVETGTPPSPEHIAQMTALIEKFSRSGHLLSTEGCLPSALGARVHDDAFMLDAVVQADSREEVLALTKEFLDVVGEGECEVRQLYEVPAHVG